MSIRVVITGRQENCTCGKEVRFFVACDLCGREIDAKSPGNVEFDCKDGSEVVFLHKECSLLYRRQKEMDGWCQLEGVDVRVKKLPIGDVSWPGKKGCLSVGDTRACR